MARAAERLIAVVVFPTPPFWFAMAMTITGGPSRRGDDSGWGTRGRSGRTLHLVFAQLVVGETLQPLLEAAHVHRLPAGGIDAPGALEDRVLDEDRRLGPEREGDGVRGAGVDRD